MSVNDRITSLIGSVREQRAVIRIAISACLILLAICTAGPALESAKVPLLRRIVPLL